MSSNFVVHTDSFKKENIELPIKKETPKGIVVGFPGGDIYLSKKHTDRALLSRLGKFKEWYVRDFFKIAKNPYYGNYWLPCVKAGRGPTAKSRKVKVEIEKILVNDGCGQITEKISRTFTVPVSQVRDTETGCQVQAWVLREKLRDDYNYKIPSDCGVWDGDETELLNAIDEWFSR